MMIDPIRQELLSGISNDETFDKLKPRLAAIEDYPMIARDDEMAARFYTI